MRLSIHDVGPAGGTRGEIRAELGLDSARHTLEAEPLQAASKPIAKHAIAVQIDRGAGRGVTLELLTGDRDGGRTASQLRWASDMMVGPPRSPMISPKMSRNLRAHALSPGATTCRRLPLVTALRRRGTRGAVTGRAVDAVTGMSPAILLPRRCQIEAAPGHGCPFALKRAASQWRPGGGRPVILTIERKVPAETGLVLRRNGGRKKAGADREGGG